MSDHPQSVQSGTCNSITILETTVFGASWRPITEFPPMTDSDPMERGHENRSSVLWLYQPAHESKNQDGTKTVWPGHVYLGMCIRPMVKIVDGYDYGEPYFIDLAHRGICAVTMWRHIDTPSFPYDPIETKGRIDGTSFNPEFHDGKTVRDEGAPSNFA